MKKWKIECRQGSGSGKDYSWYNSSNKPYVEIWAEDGRHVWSGYVKISTAEALVDRHNEEVDNGNR